ncbi:unnamed protein product [Rhizophagus irregularis]|nr:unnamed protein product [Rhizophagus irregularis]
MDTSKQNSDTTKTDVKNLWIDREDVEYQTHATIFSTGATTESDETISYFKKVNIMDLEKRKELYGVCGECKEPDFLNEINYYISGHVHADGLSVIWECVNQPKISEDTPKLIVDLIIKCWDAKAENRPTAKELRQILELVDVDDEEPVNSTDYLSSYQETVSSSSANPISECLDCELNELDLNQDDDE